MNTEAFKRKLSAILSADVEGYSRLMGEDEDATIRTLTAYRELMFTLIQKHRGRVVDSPGDNLLAEFLSVVDAVRCAVEIQEELRVRNAELPENRRMVFRIGINLGDVIQEGERIYGDGVNIAARIESLAEGGGICISGTTYDQIKNKLSFSYESLGEHTVKNIKEPVRAYRMRIGPEAAVSVIDNEKQRLRRWINAALGALAVLVLVAGAWAAWNFYLRPTPPAEQIVSEKVPASELPEEKPPPVPTEPSIAVLPFANISGDPKEDYLSDGITEQIITALSKIPQMLVIARNSVFTYKGKPVMVQQVSEELGVRYVLEGSVQKEGDRLRITAQLIDAKTGNHMWSERYDRDLKSLFALQDDITKNIIGALQVKLTQGELAGKDTNNLEAYLKVMKGQYHQWRYNKNDNEIATRLAKEATEFDPGYVSAYLLLAWTYCQKADFRWTETPWKSYEKAIELAEKAISFDEQSAPAYMALANFYAKTKRFDEAMSAGNKGLSLDPTSSNVNALYGYMMYNLGKFKQAIPFFEKAIRSDPKPPRWFMDVLGKCYYETGRFKEAISFFEKVIGLDPKRPSWGRSRMGWAYFYTGRNEEAIAAFENYVRHEPENAYAHAALGCALIAAGKPEEADTVLEKALSMNMPGVIRSYGWISCNLTVARFGTGQHEKEIKMMRNLFEFSRAHVDASVHRYMALILIFEGKYDEALSIAEEAVWLEERVVPSPSPDAPVYRVLGLSHLMKGQYEGAVEAFEEAIHSWPEYIYGHIGLAAAYSLSGDKKEAQAEAAEVLKINPDFSLSDIAKNGYYNFQKADKERFINALRRAGLK